MHGFLFVKANGIFEITGLGNEYLNLSEFKRTYEFVVSYCDLTMPSFAKTTDEKVSKPR
jgi:hypothetical protein